MGAYVEIWVWGQLLVFDDIPRGRDCQLQTCRGPLPSACLETEPCAAAGADLQHSRREFRVRCFVLQENW